MKKAPLQDVYGRPGFLLKRCHQITAALFASHCRGFKVTPSQYGALCALREYPDIDQLALGRLIGLDRHTAGLVLRLLAERGLIERSVNNRDNRSMQLRLSAAGERLLAKIGPTARRVQEAALASLPRAKRKQFLGLLELFLRGHDALINPADIVAGKSVGSRFDAGTLVRSRAPRRVQT